MCMQRFSQKSHLKTHQNVHSGERAFQCQICEKVRLLFVRGECSANAVFLVMK
jgi:hypothetical protein